MPPTITSRNDLGLFLTGLAYELWSKAAENINAARDYSIEQLAKLALVDPSDPNYDQAARDTGQAILIKLGIEAVDTGDALDAQRQKIFMTAVEIAAAFIPRVPMPPIASAGGGS